MKQKSSSSDARLRVCLFLTVHEQHRSILTEVSANRRIRPQGIFTKIEVDF